jgi:hypothetical protein
MSGKEIPVQLDLEGGFVVGRKPKATVAIKQEFDEYYDHDFANRAVKEELDEQEYNSVRIKAEFKEYENSQLAYKMAGRAIKEESEEYDYPNIAIKEEIGSDAYCMDYYELPDQEEPEEISFKQHPIRKETTTDKGAKLSMKQSTKSCSNVPRPTKTIIGPPPTLLRQTTQVVSSNIEKYHPFAFSIFSECQWESIVECRCETFDKIESSLPRNHNKLLMPPLSQKILAAIEEHPANAHLCSSRKVDSLLWRKIVEYSYPQGSITRPKVLEDPYDVLVDRLSQWGDKLVDLFDLEKKKDDINGGAADHRRSWDCEICDSFTSKRNSKKECCDFVHDDTAKASSESDQLRDQSLYRTALLLSFIHSIKCSPMDVKLLSASGIGKSVSKVVKIASKLLKKVKRDASDDDMYKSLNGYPHFWTEGYMLCCRYTSSRTPITVFQASQPVKGNERYKTVTLLEILQQLLQEWKDMASDNGVAMSSAASSSNETSSNKKQEIECTKELKLSHQPEQEEMQFPFATFGKPHNTDTEQYKLDMQLLHASLNWKSLFSSLQKREKMVREAHGEKVRASRKSLEKNRPKIGKGVLSLNIRFSSFVFTLLTTVSR